MNVSIFIMFWACQTLAIWLHAHTNMRPHALWVIVQSNHTHTRTFALQATGARLIVTPAVAEMEILMKWAQQRLSPHSTWRGRMALYPHCLKMDQ